MTTHARVSIRTLARGATRLTIRFLSISKFQPSLPQGERRFGRHAERGCNRVSTHAPTRGATSDTSRRLTRRLSFNPRSHKGSDSKIAQLFFSLRIFFKQLYQSHYKKTTFHASHSHYVALPAPVFSAKQPTFLCPIPIRTFSCYQGVCLYIQDPASDKNRFYVSHPKCCISTNMQTLCCT